MGEKILKFRCGLLNTHFSLLITHYSSLISHYSSLIAHFSLLIFAAGLNAGEPLIVDDAFIRDKGEISSITEGLHYKTDHFWSKKGKKLATYNNFKQTQVSSYVEYGLTNKDTIGAYATYAQNRECLNGTKRGIGDIEFCWKRFLGFKGPTRFSTRFLGIIPSGPEKTTVRYGKYGAEIDLHCQTTFSFYNRSGWYELLAGYRFYNGAPSDQIRANAVIGYQLYPRFRVIAGAYLEYGLFNGHKKFHGPILVFDPNYRVLKVQVQAVIQLTSYLSGILGYFQHVWGRNIGTGGGYFGGAWLDF